MDFNDDDSQAVLDVAAELDAALPDDGPYRMTEEDFIRALRELVLDLEMYQMALEKRVATL